MQLTRLQLSLIIIIISAIMLLLIFFQRKDKYIPPPSEFKGTGTVQVICTYNQYPVNPNSQSFFSNTCTLGSDGFNHSPLGNQCDPDKLHIFNPGFENSPSNIILPQLPAFSETALNCSMLLQFDLFNALTGDAFFAIEIWACKLSDLTNDNKDNRLTTYDTSTGICSTSPGNTNWSLIHITGMSYSCPSSNLGNCPKLDSTNCLPNTINTFLPFQLSNEFQQGCVLDIVLQFQLDPDDLCNITFWPTNKVFMQVTKYL